MTDKPRGPAAPAGHRSPLVRSLLCTVARGMAWMGFFYFAPIGFAYATAADAAADAADAPEEQQVLLTGPAPGHPERLEAQVRLTPQEQELWRQISSLN
ncbi:DUF6059 family protein [Streptomyces sp. NPDC001262]|uniref:DUF6059 family protein n=1 Tax=unclassified Streptomyces TaxID=2593676 RepID=UPI00368ED4A6